MPATSIATSSVEASSISATAASPQSHHKFPTGPFVGALIGGQITLVAFLILFCRWRRRRGNGLLHGEEIRVQDQLNIGSLVNDSHTPVEPSNTSSDDGTRLSQHYVSEPTPSIAFRRVPPAYSTIQRPRLI